VLALSYGGIVGIPFEWGMGGKESKVGFIDKV
jgi:hypothetical protein